MVALRLSRPHQLNSETPPLHSDCLRMREIIGYFPPVKINVFLFTKISWQSIHLNSWVLTFAWWVSIYCQIHLWEGRWISQIVAGSHPHATASLWYYLWRICIACTLLATTLTMHLCTLTWCWTLQCSYSILTKLSSSTHLIGRYLL